MRRIYTALLALVAVLMHLFVACAPEPEPGPQPEPELPQPELPQPLTESHTLTIFMQGNNGLAEFMDSNLQRILAAYYDVPEGDFRIFVFYDRGNYTRLTELYMSDGMAKQRLVEEYDTSISTVDKEFVRGVLAKVKQEAPADSYGLILSSHGGGWVPSDLYDVYLLGEGSRSNAPQAEPLFYGQDDYDCMEVGDLVDALSDTYYNYMVYLTQQSIPESVVCADLNYAIRLNFPQEYAKGIRIGFYRPNVKRQEEISPADRLSNQPEL